MNGKFRWDSPIHVSHMPIFQCPYRSEVGRIGGEEGDGGGGGADGAGDGGGAICPSYIRPWRLPL